MFIRILKYLLLFVCEFLLVFVIVILELLIKGYWGDTPLYFILIFIFLYALTCYAWASLALTGDKKKKRQLGLITGAIVGFIAAMLDDSLGLQLLQLMHRLIHIPISWIDKYGMAYTQFSAYWVTFIVATILQVVFWEIQNHKEVISFRKDKREK
jgi:hypothetical protein